MTERQLQGAVIDCARLLGWRVAHFRPAKTAKGWRTPVEADGAGWPDLTLIRDGYLIFAELKAATGRLSADQHVWLDDLLLVSVAEDRVLTFLWTPQQWLDGSIEQVLRDTRNYHVDRRAA